MEGPLRGGPETFLRGMAAMLMDETRNIIERVWGFADIKDFIEDGADHLAKQLSIRFNHFYQQKQLIFIGFEARAMREQFEFYSKGIDLLPFGGDPSIPFKWESAEYIGSESKRYNLPIKEALVLYFGDFDKKGREIFETAKEDITTWCAAPVLFEWCGLTEDHIARYRLPENPEKPGQYQWEALTDPQAKEIIEGALRSRLDLALIERCDRLGEKLTKQWQAKVKRFLEKEFATHTAT